ncbi:MAG: cation:proton antiporter [Spirosomaceae bacterium]|nr:cation:proton antiporter [Spirosomataceae bacterium]
MKRNFSAFLIVCTAFLGQSCDGDAFEKAKTLMQQGNYREALGQLNEAIEQDKNNYEAFNARGVAYFELKEYTNALLDYDQAIRLNPEAYRPFYNRALLRVAQNNANEALKDYAEAIRREPRNADIFVNRGQLLAATGQADAALRDFDQAVALDASGLFLLVMKQMGLGLIFGLVFGLLTQKLIKLLRLQTAHNVGLNAIFLVATGLAVFATSNYLGGSGFLSIYIFGVIIGNTEKRLVRQSIPALDGLAWLFQSAMFLILGLLATPTQVLQSATMGLVLSLALIFIARPIGVMPILALFQYSKREQLFIAWVGLRGAVPIVIEI